MLSLRFSSCNAVLARTIEVITTIVQNTKFIVKVNRGGVGGPQYVLRLDRTPILMTTNRKLAMVMGRLTAEDAVVSMQTARCSPELVPVQVRVSPALVR